MINLTPEIEETIADALKAKIALDAENVISDEPLFDSKADVIESITIETIDGKTEVVYCKLSFLGFTDSDTDGCDDMPVVFLNYGIHFFRQFCEKRSDDSSSEKDLKTLILNLRNRFLDENRALTAKVEHAPLKQTSFIILGDDPLTGVFGHYADLSVRVEIV